MYVVLYQISSCIHVSFCLCIGKVFQLLLFQQFVPQYPHCRPGMTQLSCPLEAQVGHLTPVILYGCQFPIIASMVNRKSILPEQLSHLGWLLLSMLLDECFGWPRDLRLGKMLKCRPLLRYRIKTEKEARMFEW